MTQEEINQILKKHSLWLAGKKGGESANLKGADLIGAYLKGADLYGASL